MTRKGPAWAWRLQDAINPRAALEPAVLVLVVIVLFRLVVRAWPEFQFSVWMNAATMEPQIMAWCSVAVFLGGYALGKAL